MYWDTETERFLDIGGFQCVPTEWDECQELNGYSDNELIGAHGVQMYSELQH